jgi:peptide/nickel transport system substrate-binding protein
MRTKNRLFRLPTRADWHAIFSSFTKKEWYLFLVFVALLFISTLVAVYSLSSKFEVSVPSHGGELVEGVIGTPRYVNPVIALTDADRDLTALIYSGLTREGAHNTLVPDIAEQWTVDEAGLTYTFTIKEGALFQDGEPITAEDVVFTVEAIQSDILKSPLRVKWEGVTSEAVDSRTVVFTLKQPFVGFLENTTVGILPKHIWENASSEEFSFSDFNIKPIGAGPYRVESVSKDSSGVPEEYTLRAYDDAPGGEPFIETMTIRFYPNEDERLAALKSGSIDQAGSVSPLDATLLADRNMLVDATALPRVFGVYFNQNKAEVLNQTGVKTAIDKAIDREAIVREALYGFGTPIASPVPPGLIPNLELPAVATQDIAGANALLDKNGWTIGEDGFRSKTIDKKVTPLRFSIATSDTPELKRTAEIIRDNLSLVGIFVDIKVYDTGTLNQQIIRERDYDALLFGKVVSQESDLFAFWHSSQRNDPGLNVSGYVNKTVDAILEKNAKETDASVRTVAYASFIKEILTDKPAVFLFSPSYIYVSNKEVGGRDLVSMGVSSERFANVTSWYTNHEKLWPLFTSKQ